MEKKIYELLAEMKNNVAGLSPREAAEVALQSIMELKDLVLANDFPDDAERIAFYKKDKPAFVAELYYHLRLYRLECELPEPLRLQRRHLQQAVKSLNRWFDDHRDFCRYDRSGATDKDAEYYQPGYTDRFTPLFSFDRDPAFCTAKGHEAALLLANRRLLVELENRLAVLKQSDGPLFRLPKLNWTYKAIDLVELIYGLYLTGAVKAELKDIAETFQQVFDVKLDNYSFTFTQSIHYRKSGSIRFLREMIEAILKKLDDLDGK